MQKSNPLFTLLIINFYVIILSYINLDSYFYNNCFSIQHVCKPDYTWDIQYLYLHPAQKLRMGKMAKVSSSRQKKGDRKCNKCGSSHPPPTGQKCHAAQMFANERMLNQSQTQRELFAGDESISSRLTPNGSPPSSSSVASSPSRPTRLVEQSLDLLAMSMETLTGKVTKMQAHITEL